MVIKKKCSREITLWTSAIDVYKYGKTRSVCCIKTREREKGGEREKETDLKLEKTFQSPCSQQVASGHIDCHACMKKV